MPISEIPKKQGEMTAAEAVSFFDGVKDNLGHKLVQSEKRGRLRWLFEKLYHDAAANSCSLPDGTIVPIIVRRRDPGRAAACYLNTADVAPDIILKAFAAQTGIIFKKSRPMPKQAGELIVSEAKRLFDGVVANGKKLSGFKKQDKLNSLFQLLYQTPAANICHTAQGDIPIIVERMGINNKTAYCLNASNCRCEVLSAFAAWAGCVYLPQKEDAVTPPEKKQGELTSRECARIFHKVDAKNGCAYKKYTSERLADWFRYIYENPSLNQTGLPNGAIVELVVYRQSYAQKCHCLNTADDTAMPFVLRRVAEIANAEICFDNLKLQPKSKSSLHKAIVTLEKARRISVSTAEQEYYRAYAEKAYAALVPEKRNLTVTEWLAAHAASKQK